MERVLFMLISALKVAALHEERSTLVVVPMAEVWAAALADLPLEQSDREELVELSRRLANRTQIAAILATLNRIAQTIIAQIDEQPQLARQIDERHAVLTAILAIHTLASDDATDRIDVRIDSLALFDYVEQIYIKATQTEPGTLDAAPSSATDDKPDTILVVARPDREMSVAFKGHHYIERRTTVTYRHGQRHPQLHIRTPTKSAIDERPYERKHWIQKTSSAYDLDVYTYQNRRMGRIQTRPISTLSRIAGQQLGLTFSLPVNTQLLATSLLEGQRELTQCIQLQR